MTTVPEKLQQNGNERSTYGHLWEAEGMKDLWSWDVTHTDRQ